VTTTDVLAAFTRVREAAETHMEQRDALGLGWSEEAVTEVSIHQGHPRVRVVQFNRHQEGAAVGADYMWWWLDDSPSDMCFGMLVQAKRLSRDGQKWKLDIRHNHGTQYEDLLKTGLQLQVPTMYGVYTGGPTFRAGLPCFHDRQPDCLGCRRMAISMISAYQLDLVFGPTDAATFLFNESMPLEDLVDPRRPAGQVHDLNLPEIPAGPLREFLLEPQDGPREIAKRIFKLVSDTRRGMFSAASAEPITVRGAPVFPEVPEDSGHFRGPYFQHFLQGLRHSPPSYVQELLEQQIFYDVMLGPQTPGIGQAEPPAELRGLVDGVVLISM
jgi:hypothetical protein